MDSLLNSTFGVITCCAASFIIAIFIELIMLPRILLISRRKRLYDMPNKRKSHTNPVPRLAGITFLPVILLSFLPVSGLQAIYTTEYFISYSAQSIIRLSFIICGALPLMLLGVKDDLIGVRYSHKFIIQILSAVLLISSGTYINNLHGLLGIYELSPYIGVPFTALLTVYIINSINLIDGVDGLAATLSISASAILGACLISVGSHTTPILAFAIVGTLIPFLYYNTIAQRKLFMGDTGSLTLGYMLSLLAISYSMQPSAKNIISGIPPIIIAWSVLFVPLFDTARVMCVRASQGKPIFNPDRNHIHHKLLDLGCSHRKITLILTTATFLITIFNVLLYNLLDINLILIFDLAAGILFNVYLNRRRRKKIGQKTLEQSPSIPLGDFSVTTNYRFDSLPKRQVVVNTINPHSWVTTHKDAEFKQALLESDALIPDGTGIVLAAQWLAGVHICKIAGADLHRQVLRHLNEVGGSVFYLGASDHTLAHITERIRAEHPRIRVSTYSPPYRERFSDEETAEMIAAVNAFKPDVLFVGMTAPKQEKWIAANRHLLQTHFISGIGAVFGFYGGTTPRPPQWMIRLGLEWLGRLIKEPRRMWKRNFISTPKFLFEIVQLKFKKKNNKKVTPHYEIS
ncbi:WecB/TagA/CpsF family glycosyltransferase [Bacteroides sp.]